MAATSQIKQAKPFASHYTALYREQMRIRLACILLVTAVMLANVTSVSARQWKPTPLQAAQEYLNLNHAVNDGSNVFLFWIAPQYVGCETATEIACQNLTRYTVIGIVHYNLEPSGRVSYREITDISVEANSSSYNPLPEDQINPALTGFLAYFTKSMSEGLGKVGAGVRFFVFDTKTVDSCAEGTVRVEYLEERYEYETPLPGC